MAYLRLSLLGPFQVILGGQPVTRFESNKVRALLAYLALEADRPHRREVLAALLWPEWPEQRARTYLRSALADLRTAIGDRLAIEDHSAPPPYLSISRSTIQFNRFSDCWVDVWALQDRVEGEEDDPSTIQRLEEKLSLYRGSFLEGFSLKDSPAFDDWALVVRERIERQASRVTQRLVVAYLEQGECERACERARHWVEVEPWSEEAHRHLMRALALSGRRSAALAQYEACRRALRQELNVEPGPETVQLYEQIRNGEITPQASGEGVAGRPRAKPDASKGNLPAALTPFVGRKRELADLGHLLADPNVRLVTVVGPGGSGKTRLALEAAAAEVDRYAHGAWFVSLAALRAVEEIVPTVAQALGFPLSGEREPREQLLDYLRHKQILLLLDNCEHLLAGGELFAEMLRAAPDVRLLATSHVRLGLQGETAFELAGMSCPPEGESAAERLSAYSAAALFVSAAQRVRPGWAPEGDEPAQIARLCRQVQGMPLALLLAAAWMDTLSPDDIARQVERDLGFLETDWRDVPERQRSMRAVCDGSWRMLTERERATFAALALFRGGFTAEAAQEVGSADVRTLRALVHKSFLQVDRGRYAVHELLRQYAQEKLDRFSNGGQGARERHAAYYLRSMERWASELAGARQPAALGEMEVELGNLRTAWEWAVAHERWAEVGRAAETLARFHDWRRRGDEARILFRQATERLFPLVAARAAVGPQAISALVELLARQAVFELDDEGQLRLAQRCQELLALPELAGHDVRRQKALVLKVFARTLSGGEMDRARAFFQESLALYRALGDRWMEASVLLKLGVWEWTNGRVSDAGRLWEESLAFFHALGSQYGVASCLHRLYQVYAWQGRFAEAEQLVEERMALAREWGDLASLAQAYEMLLGIRYFSGRFAEAVEVIDKEFLPRLEELGDRYQWAVWSAWCGHAKLANGEYGAARASAERSLALGREMHNREVICTALPILAEQALLEERHEEACRLYRETLAVADEAGFGMWWIDYGGEWAAAELRLGRRDAARRCLYAALRAAVDGRAGTMPIRLLPGAALWLASEGRAERAVEVYALALRYPHIANFRWYQDVFGPPMAGTAASLPPEVVRAAQARGRARDLEATIRELLAELEA